MALYVYISKLKTKIKVNLHWTRNSTKDRDYWCTEIILQ